MTFLDRSIWHCCGYNSSPTIGDAFERFVPAAWSAVYLMACLDYLIVPLLGGNLPRWWSAALVAATGTSVIGLSSSIYGFPRGTSSLTAEEGCDGDGDATIGRTKTRRRRRAVAVEMAFILYSCEKIKTDPSAMAIPNRPSLESANGSTLASDSLWTPLQQIGSVSR